MVFKNKLQYRIILFVFVILVVIGLIGDGTMLYLQRQATVSHFRDSTVVLADTLRDSLERDMLLVERQHVQESASLMASRPPINFVAVISVERKVFASSEVSTVGQIIQDDRLTSVFNSGVTVTRTGTNNGTEDLYVDLPVMNKPDCYKCHGSAPLILGAIEIGMDAKQLNAQLQAQTLIMILVAGITLMFIGGTLTYMFRSSVINPISKLITSARRIAGGDLSARVEIQRDDEVGMMAKSFNEMAARVEQNARALEASKVVLEETVQERTKQLQETAGIRGQLLERLISAQEEERRRVARELHDEAGQALSAIMLDLARAIDALPPEAVEAREKLLQSRGLAAQTLAELRKMIYDLRPEVLDQLGLAPAIRSYVKSHLESNDIKTKLSFSGLENRLSPSMETTIFRIIQEATTNIVRHSEATAVTIKVAASDLMVNTMIEDNGKGFDVQAGLKSTESWGLRGIRERVGIFGGHLSITSEPGKGTRIQFQIPLEGAGQVDFSYANYDI